jgi:hypothetical protein
MTYCLYLPLFMDASWLSIFTPSVWTTPITAPNMHSMVSTPYFILFHEHVSKTHWNPFSFNPFTVVMMLDSYVGCIRVCSLEVVSEEEIRSILLVLRRGNGLKRDVIKIFQDNYYNYYIRSICIESKELVL